MSLKITFPCNWVLFWNHLIWLIVLTMKLPLNRILSKYITMFPMVRLLLKIPDTWNLREGVNLVEFFSPWFSPSKGGALWRKGMGEQSCLVQLVWKQNRGIVSERKGPESRYSAQGHYFMAHSDTPEVCFIIFLGGSSAS